MIGILQRGRVADPTLTLVGEMVRLMHDRWGTLPSHVWRDPYVLAYMQIVIAGLLSSRADGDSGDEDHHLAVARVWRQATGQHPFCLLQKMSVPWAERGIDAQRGAQDAALWLAFYTRRPDLADPHVKKVLEVVEGREHDGLVAFGELGSSLAAAAGMLFCSSILRRVGALAQAAAA